jgi:hypothetical protein
MAALEAETRWMLRTDNVGLEVVDLSLFPNFVNAMWLIPYKMYLASVCVWRRPIGSMSAGKPRNLFVFFYVLEFYLRSLGDNFFSETILYFPRLFVK